MIGSKKVFVRTLIIFYGISYLLQNTLFVDRKKVYAAETPSTTNIVAVFVDKNIYEGIKTNLERYTTSYIQQKIANSKAVVFPIDTTTMKAFEISKMLENMYFEGIKDQSSKLVGTILIGDVPLPVVQNNGFIYPSIFPYVDFEHQEFVYDSNKKFFVYNDNPNGQAELWHGIIKFDTAQQYNTFFNKVKSYKENPIKFIDKAIRYEDFIGLKKYFIPENTKYYINNLLFAEDMGYHRYNNLLLNTLKSEHNDSSLAVGNDLKADLQTTTDPDLKAYATDIGSRNDQAAATSQDVTSSMPTLTLKKAIQEMLKGYDGLISSQFLSKIKDNINGLARRYKTTEGETFTDYGSLTNKIAQKDNRLLGDPDNNVQPLLIQINDFLEKGLNNQIEQEKYYMTMPIPISELDFAGETRRVLGLKPKKICTRKTYNYYENYFFGKNANLITSAGQTSIYRGTFQNLTSIDNQSINKTGQSIGGSYDLFSTQVEANRGYDFNTTKDELERYAKYKTNYRSLRQLKCTNYFLGLEKILGIEGICLSPRFRSVDDGPDENKCYTNDPEKQGGCETMNEFAARSRGGASPMNMDSTTQKLVNYNYKNATQPIYNIAGSKKINVAQQDANSYQGAITYTNIIQRKFGVGDSQYGSNDIMSLISNPQSNGSNLTFTNQLPVGDLKSPMRIPVNPKTYAQTNFFSLFGSLPNHIINAGKAVLYNVNPGQCGGDGSIYKYKTIDSRVKNISPTRDQITDTEFYKFKDSSDLEVFYNEVIKDLAQTKTDILTANTVFSGTDSADRTGVISNLTNLKTIVTKVNSGMQQIIAFNTNLLTGYSGGQVTQLANIRSGIMITPNKLFEINDRIIQTNEGLDVLFNYINSLSMNTVALSFAGIIQSENFKNQKVEILDSRKSNILQNMNYITANVATLKSTFTTARGIYNTIGLVNNNLAIIQAKRDAINALDESCLPSLCGCDISHYKPVCDVLDKLIVTLQTDLTAHLANSGVNDKLTEIAQYQSSNGIVHPLLEINQAFSPAKVLGEMTQVKSTMNAFDVSSNPDKKEKNKGMNLTTQDRPIDNIRNITFQGVGGDMVRLNYVNLYEVKTYKEIDGKLELKTPTEIREAIKKYLTDKATEYNTLLEAQKNKKNQWYQSYSSQFNLLGQVDPLANPNTHNYNLIPTDYFINQLITFLDTIENSPEYGKKAIYGIANSATIDDKLDMIAKLLYYQNITWPERLQQTSVAGDIEEIKSSFDVNRKISNIVNTYLTEGSDQGKFITPIYNTTGYEVGYINSDGEDYVSSKPLPSFIQQIQAAQEKSTSKTNTPANAFRETTSSSDELQAQADSCEGVDAQGVSLLFDISTMSSPWMKAMKCRGKQILKKPFDIKISFANSVGPIVTNTIQDTQNTIQNTEAQWKQYGSQRTAPNNDDIINNAPDGIKQKLQGYNNSAIINIDKTIVGVDDSGSTQIKVGMTDNLGDINVKISGTGDNCFAINRNKTVLSDNICTKPAKEFYNPNTDEYVFDSIIKQKKAGVTTIKIELCPAGSNICIVKQQVISILPGPIKTITLQSPTDIVMEGAELPLVVYAADKYNNQIGQNIQAYTISLGSGNGKIYDGTNENSSIKFDNFLQAGFIYRAPTGIQANEAVTITIAQDQLKLLGTTEKPNVVQKKIIVAKGIVNVLNKNVVIYTSNTPKNTPQQLTFNLPKDETDIQYQDENGISEIKPENIPSLVITIKDKNGNRLDTVANITSKEGFLSPGTTKDKTITKNGITKKQTLFSPGNDFIIKDGQLNISLYPNFKAGNDAITINIPGIDPIIIPIVVNPGTAKTVILQLEKSRMDFTTTTGSKGTIHVVDSWNNNVTSGTTIKLGVIGAANSSVSEFNYNGNEYTYMLSAKKPGGEGYVFAYIKERALSDQTPGYEKFIVQESILPKEKLNVMYLNLFGTDRGNQRGYFSENNKIINTITNQSNKLLATTTELVDPSKIKQIEFILNPHGQIQSINNKTATLTIENKKIIGTLPNIAKIDLGLSNQYKIQTLIDSGAISEFKKDSNTLIYIAEPTDSIISGNQATTTKVTINGIDVIDINKGNIDPNITIIADNEILGDMSIYTIRFNGTTIGKFMLWNNGNITSDKTHINLQDPATYGMTNIFSEGSTNTQGIGIYINGSAFTKQGYQSIEDSTDAMLGIGFTSNFKNVSNFANGQSVGEATLPYGSQFLVNFGDPLLERKENNPNIPNTDFDASIGQTIYADPNKTIFKVIPIDFNNDGVKDLIVVYTDGVVKLLKNYGGNVPYKDLQELMIIAEPIKEIKIGDVDGNGYEDIFIITNNNKGIVYLNNKGVFAVDGKNICLNINTEPGTKNPIPDNFGGIQQLFVQDMNQDGKLDIVTNDTYNDVKIFYGGSTNNGANYVSSTTGICDSQRYERQKNNYKTVKRFGTKINSSRYIQDTSLIHRKGETTSTEGVTEELDTEAPDSAIGMSKDQVDALKDQTMNDVKSMIANNDTYVAAGSTQLAYTDNPLSTAPVYESLPPSEISYLPINETNDFVSVYKEYVDINGGVLRENDEVAIQTTIISKKNNNKLTYIDELKGPRSLATDPDNKISSFTLLSGDTNKLNIDRKGPEGYQFVIDNIQLDSGQSLSFSYTARYKQTTPTTKIDVADQDLITQNKHKDTYPDITINSMDACVKNRWILFNTTAGNKTSYEQVYDDIQKDMNEYNSGAKSTQQSAMNGMVDQLSSIDSLDAVSTLPGMDSLEPRSSKNLMSSLTQEVTPGEIIQPGGVGLTINTSFIDNATAKVSKKMDAALEGLCQGFKLGKGGCQGLPVPFNQAFLAPGDYHVFGCVPKLPNPLYAAFKTLNNTLGKGMPLLTIPGNRGPTAVGYLPIPGIFGYPFKGATDGFYLGNLGGTYPSLFRLYIAPTLTLGLGIAMCFGPYTVGKALPKPFRDLGGNCVVFAVPPLTKCTPDKAGGGDDQPNQESLGSSMVAAAGQGTCNNPPRIGNSIVFANGIETTVNTSNSPFQMVAAGSSENNPPYSAAIPQGNFGGLISIDQDPTRVSAAEDYGNATQQAQLGITSDGFDLQKGEKINLKLLGAKGKGLVKCVVQKWMTSQIQYIQNNLTKMTIQVDLPDLSTVFQGFDKIGNLSETYNAINEQDQAAGYIKSTNGQGIGSGNNGTQYLSKQQLNNISQKAGSNPFEAIQQMFNEVPLINIDSKDVNIKIPSLTIDDIKKYQSYLTLWIAKNGQIIDDWTNMFNQILAICGTIDKPEAQKIHDDLTAALAKIPSGGINDNIKQEIQVEISNMQKIIDKTGAQTQKQLAADISKLTENLNNTITRIATLPSWKARQVRLEGKKKVATTLGNTFDNQALLDLTNVKVKSLEQCAGVAGSLDGFIKFKENSAGLIKSIKENIKVLDKYKEFPTQLYEWTHLTDRYLTEISSLLSSFVGSTTSWLNTNANRFSQYVDAIVLLVGTIKTRQAIIDFSVNRSEKCSKCSNDNYGSFSCSLSFLCPKLPIFPIPPFKIPSIYMDMSHIDLGMNIVLPKINFVPIKIPLPQLPNLPEPPSIEVNWDVLFGLNLDFFKNISLPTVPVIPGPPTLPEPPSFIPTVKMDLPVLPPAPKIPKIAPDIKIVLNVAKFIGKVFCIIKGGIGLVGEKGVKGKIEQITQRTWNVPIFDYFNLTTKFKSPPLQGFDYKMDAYMTLKFNFDGVYDVFNSIASASNKIVSQVVEAPIQQAVDLTTNTLNNNAVVSGLNTNLDQNINFNGYHSNEGETGMIEYKTAYDELKEGLISFKNATLEDKNMNNRVKTILATVDNKSMILPATSQIQQVEKEAKGIISKKIKENQNLSNDIKNYDTFIKTIQNNEVALVAEKTLSTSLKSPLLTIDSPTKNILQSQEDPNKSYLSLNKRMVQGYLDAVNNDGPEKLNMSQTTYNKSKIYLENTKEKIDTALLAYNDKPLLAQTTCTNCTSNATENNNYSADMSAYVNGVFIASYSGSQKNMINTVTSVEQSQNVQKTYMTDFDLNNDKLHDILMYDANSIYIKYAKQELEHFSKGGATLTKHYNTFYSYATEHQSTRINPQKRYIESLDQLSNNTDAYGYLTINNITIKVMDKNTEVKNFKTDGQSFDTLQLSWKNSKIIGEDVDGYLIKVSNRVDSKDMPSSFRSFLGGGEKPKYIVVLPKDTDYKKGLLTIDENLLKKPINLQLGQNILAVEYYDEAKDKINVTLKDLPREWLYTSIATLKINQKELSSSQQKTLVLYKKTSSRSNQTVAGMQNLGDTTAPVGDVILWRNVTSEAISTGLVHEGYINTSYTLKSIRTDNVIVAKMIIQKDGKTLLEKDNQSQTGTIDLGGLFFTGDTEQNFDFIAIDQNNNITKQNISVNIATPDIEVLDVKKTGEATADIIAKISNDLDEGMVIFQRLRNGIRSNISGSNQNTYGGFDLSPKQTIITGGIFTMGDDIGLYDNQNNEIATINSKTNEIKIKAGFENKFKINLSFTTHIPVVEVIDTIHNVTLFQIVLPIQSISNIEMNQGKPNYEELQLTDGQFGDFNNGYCVKNIKNDCIVYTNKAGAIYIPGIYANSLVGQYVFDTTTKNTKFIVKDQSNQAITTFTVQIKPSTK
ncbi:MAG: VCBS repeat-containing protein [candidate division SR1 bacterium]|nr:VCBS repeat-containing protein [candidate division SR1 bacterium]